MRANRENFCLKFHFGEQWFRNFNRSLAILKKQETKKFTTNIEEN